MSDKVTVAEVAQEAGASSQEIIEKAANLGIELKNVKSTETFDQAEELVNYLVTGKIKDQKKPNLVKKEIKVVKKVNDEVSTKKTEEPKQTKIIEDDIPASITKESIEVKEEPKQTPKTLETTKTETKTMETVIEIKIPLSQGLRKTGGL